MEILHAHERKALAERLSNDIDAAIVAEPRGNSWRLGPSSMDTQCDRRVWYGFRWVKADTRDARMTRLLDHGKMMEARFEGWLVAAGVKLWTIDPNASPNALNKQYRVRAVGGHVGGYLDGIAILPESYDYPYPIVAEFKSAGAGKSGSGTDFNKTKADVFVGKPEHAEQFGYYGWKCNYRYSVYMALNKNDDDMTVQIAENDFGKAQMLEARMLSIILSHNPPTRISEDITNFQCKLCTRFNEICHKGAPYEKNCRSCDYSEPIPGGEWQCNFRSQTIPRDIVKVGCDQYHPVGR